MRVNIKAMLYTLVALDITEARNAEIALAAMRSKRFDLVICDYNLGAGQNGQQLLEEAKYCKLLPHTAIFIMVTAENTQNLVLGAMENKPDDYITKPFNAQLLLGRLQKHFLRKQYVSEIEHAMDNGDYQRAIQHCDDLLSLNNRSTHTILLKMRAELAMAVGDLTTAAQKYQEILRQRELGWARHGLGVIAFLQNDFEQAIKTFQRVITETPMLMESYDCLANALEATGQPEAAKLILAQAIEISPNSILRQQKLARIATHTGDLELAKRAYQAAIYLGKFSIHKSCNDFFNLAKLYTDAKENITVVKLLAAMLSEYRAHPEAQLCAALIEAEIALTQKQTFETKQAVNKIHQLHANVHKMPKNLQLDTAKTLYQAHSPQMANKIIQDLIGNNIDDEVFLTKIREVYQHTSYLNDAEQLIQQCKQELVDINNNAVTLFKQGQSTAALAQLEAAMRKMPDNKTIVLNRAIILLQDMKARGCDSDKISAAEHCIKKASALGVPHTQINQLQIEFAKLAHIHATRGKSK